MPHARRHADGRRLQKQALALVPETTWEVGSEQTTGNGILPASLQLLSLVHCALHRMAIQRGLHCSHLTSASEP